MCLCFPRRKRAEPGYLAAGPRLARYPSNYTDDEPAKAPKPYHAPKPQKRKNVRFGGDGGGNDTNQQSMVNTQLQYQAMLAVVMATGSEYQPHSDHGMNGGSHGHDAGGGHGGGADSGGNDGGGGGSGGDGGGGGGGGD
ncbi:hypothetical protein FALBO_12203 [Fusarium albosuccineum]|uniref:Uncharacterized protein n=1 Tax=Fusarium albosuccineum TaxID=1237068 RepID=A0A8H4L3G9_9HYPO|nr:hypothetical protein FALBO_12203 [Fusarium albosuccineum]KAF5007437.1 hypothetical protein FDECE_6243 [Fusarium decemcellulare]